MKKIVGIIAAAALATSAFAEVNIGLSHASGWAPVAYDGDDIITAGPAHTWDQALTPMNYGRTGISFKAENDVAGVVTDIHVESYDSDNWYGYVKPFSFLKLAMGRIDTSWKRIGFGYGGWNGALRVIGAGDEGDDLAFWRPDHSRVAVTLTPVEGLEIQYDYLEATAADNQIYDELWNHARFGAAYTIEGVGTIMAQVWGKDNGWTKDSTDSKAWGVINAAFQLTGVENLEAQFGVRVPTTFKPVASDITIDETTGDVTVTAAKDSMIQFGTGITYKMDPVAFHAFFDGRMTTDDFDSYNKFGFGVGGGLDFSINDAYKLVGDVRYYGKWYDVTSEGKDRLAFYAGLEHYLTNATVKLGFTGCTNKGATSDKFVFSVPLAIDVNF